jgi:3'(2'), 5'-bisphosphate nucleotidase
MANPGLLDKIIEASREAGRAVLEVYGSGDFGVSYKDDRSPLTLADKRSHEIILKALGSLASHIPVLSEEGRDIGHAGRRVWERFFLVDPLDGTKEFLSRNGEFTVNIALMEEARPVLGVIHVPVKGVTYYAEEGKGAFKKEGDKAPVRISVKEAPSAGGLVVVASRSHGSEALEEYLKGLKVSERISAGSSLKFCLVAEGAADIYPRFGPTWEWDTAAGHALVLEAGGLVTDTGGKEDLHYNKEVIKHAGFIVWGSVRPSTLETFRKV